MAKAKPNFFIVGAAKSGTTSLYNYILQHPQIWMPSLKEPHYFGEHRPPGPTIANLQEYLSLFAAGEHFEAVGEASTAYLYSASAAREIFAFNPEAKIVMVLRNPVDRAYSLYWHNVRAGVESIPFEDALEAEAVRIRDGWRYSFHYVASGMYADQVRRFQSQFGIDRVKVFLFEELQDSAAELVDELFEFLGVDTVQPISVDKVYNKSGPPKIRLINAFLHKKSSLKKALLSPIPASFKRRWKSKVLEMNAEPPPSMPVELRAQLVDTFKEDIGVLSGLIDRDLACWLERPR